jgi:predicted acylesterase/phospholipase RssA
MDKYDYMVFSGGGINGAYFLGAVQFLRMLKQDWKGFAGTSVGALLAFFCTLKLPVHEMIAIFSETMSQWDAVEVYPREAISTRAVIDHSLIVKAISTQLLRKFNKTDMTFKELFEKTGIEFVVCAQNLNKIKSTLFRQETTPDVSVVSAIAASMSIPLVFPPVEIDGDLYIDGGIMLNIPIKSFQLDRTLGIWLRSLVPKVTTSELRGSVTCYLKQLSRCVWFTHDELMSSMVDRKNIVEIEPMNFGLPMPMSTVDLQHVVFNGGFVCYMHFRDLPLSNSALFSFILFIANAVDKKLLQTVKYGGNTAASSRRHEGTSKGK